MHFLHEGLALSVKNKVYFFCHRVPFKSVRTKKNKKVLFNICYQYEVFLLYMFSSQCG